MRVPQEVKEAAKPFIEEYGAVGVKRAGDYRGYSVYVVCQRKDSHTGFPHLFLYKKGEELQRSEGWDSLRILREVRQEYNRKRREARLEKKQPE